jgi:hypothetical protein
MASESQKAAKAMADVYAAPLSSFVKVRDQVARRLRDEGNTELAEAVAKTRKPTLPAWALTKLVLSEPRRLEDVEAADQKLTDAMAKGKAEAVRTATHDRHRTIGDVVDAAADMLEQEGHKASTSIREKMAQTLYALSGDDEARAQLRAGLLSKELEPSGFGGLPEVPAPSETDAGISRLERRATKLADEAKSAEGRARDATKKADELERELDTLKREVERASKHADRASAAAHEKREEADEAARLLAEQERG